MSVTEISGSASMGEIKNPCKMHLAIHSPLLVTYALHGLASAMLDIGMLTSKYLCPNDG